MNPNQKLVLAIGLIAVFAQMVFPPWIPESPFRTECYSFLFDSNHRSVYNLNYELLGIQLFATVVIVAFAYVATSHSRKPDSSPQKSD